MTILIKDMGEATVTGYTGTAANDAYVSTSVDVVDSPSIGPDGQMPPAILNDGRLNVLANRTTKGIYLATASEYNTAASELFPASQYSNYDFQAAKMAELARTSGFGQPIYFFPAGYYLAIWNGDHGIGFYAFVGYVAPYPSQTLYYNPATQTYSPTQINFADQYADAAWKDRQAAKEAAEASGSATPEDLLEDELTGGGIVDLTPSDGYNFPFTYDPNSGAPTKVSISIGGTPYFVTPIYSTGTTVTTTTTMPASEATAGLVPYSFIVAITNRGWNSWARSINPVAVGQYFICTAMDGIYSAQLAIGPQGKEGKGINTFSHSLLVDSEGVKVYENAVEVATIKAVQSSISKLRIYRHSNNTIHYVVTTGTETIVYRSLLPCPFPLVVPLYVYGHLYTSGDRILTADMKSGEIHYGSV